MRLFLFLFLFCPITAFSLKFQHLTTENGLQSNHVYCIHQDTLGFMWFGTDNGLHRWDGYEFRIFKHDPFDSSTLSHSDIKYIYQDQSHNLWISTQDGLNQFNLLTERITRFHFGKNGTLNNVIKQIVAEGDSILWFGTYNGLVRFCLKSKDYKRFIVPHKDESWRIKRNRLWTLDWLENGRLLMGTSDKFMQFDPAHQKFERFTTPVPDSLNSQAYSAFIGEHKLWCGFSNWEFFRRTSSTAQLKHTVSGKKILTILATLSLPPFWRVVPVSCGWQAWAEVLFISIKKMSALSSLPRILTTKTASMDHWSVIFTKIDNKIYG